MKAIDELIKAIKVKIIELDSMINVLRLSDKLSFSNHKDLTKKNKTVYDDLEQLKAELKEQHKKDVVVAFRDGQKDGILTVNYSHKTKKPEQYYNQNH